MTAPNGAKSHLARAVWLPANRDTRSCAGLLALQQAGAPALLPGAGPARRSVSSPFGSMDGRRSYRAAGVALFALLAGSV
jgi:hypothetical protein